MADLRSIKRIVAPLAGALVVLFVLLIWVAWIPVRRSRDAWRDGRNAEAVQTANSWSRLGLWRTQYQQVLAAALLTVGNRKDAEPHLRALSGGRTWFAALSKEEVARRLFARSRYEEFLLYDDAVRDVFGRDYGALYRAAALAATGKLTQAEETLRSVDEDDVDATRLQALRQAIEVRKRGIYTVVIDRHGAPIADYHAANKDLVAINADFAPLVDTDAGALTLEDVLPFQTAQDTFQLTLDAEMQKAAMNALSGFRASLVAIDPRTNEIVAIASSRGNQTLDNLAMEGRYEPGSVIKVLTALNGYQSGFPVDSMFPYTCTGALAVDGRSFGDWLPGGHGTVSSIDEALAQSCNVVFADLGIRLGARALAGFMTAAGFDSNVNLGVLQIPLGSLKGKVFNKFETGFFAIGLEHETINTLHLAMLASMMANRGVLTTPRLLTGRRSILGEITGVPPKSDSRQIASRAAAERVINGMQAVVTHPQGSGRRAVVQGVPLAMKTGTAGKREEGYTALVMAFAPVQAPRIAFAAIAEGAGPAEFAAAKITHDFVRAIAPRLK